MLDKGLLGLKVRAISKKISNSSLWNCSKRNKHSSSQAFIFWWNYGYWSKANLMLFSKFPKTGLINFQILLSILLDHSWFKRMGGPFRGIERKLSESTEITNFLFLFWASMFSLWNSQIFRAARIGNDQLEKNRRNAISWQSNVTNYYFSDKESLNKSQYINWKSRVFLIYTAFFVCLEHFAN